MGEMTWIEVKDSVDSLATGFEAFREKNDQRLDEIDEEIACQELRSDAATLLSRYSTSEPKTW